MPTPFDTLTIAQIQQAIRQATPADYADNAKLYAGDHWLDGAGWMGPQPPVGDAGYAQIMCEIKRAFTSKNAVRETVRRHVAGVVGKEMAWGLTVRRALKEGQKPTKKEQALIDEAEALLTEWWDERGLHTLIKEALATALIGSRAALRLFVPPGELDADGTVPVADLRTSLFRIYVQSVAPTQATVITDAPTQRQAGVYVYVDRNQTYAELTYRDGEATIIRILGGETADSQPLAPLSLDGKLLLHEVQRPLLITKQVRENQAQLNLAKTMLGRNVVQGGFLERIILNGQLPGTWVDDPSAPDGRRFVPQPFRVGPGTTNFIAGATYTDEDGTTHMASPSVVYRDPVRVDTFEATERAAYRSILEETHQLHALISGDATASGESRKQAMADFLADLLESAPEVQRAVRWLLETALSLAALFAQQPGRFASLRATCDVRLNPGPVSADEQRLNLEQVDKETLSRETAMSRNGVEDVDAELARIAAEKAERQAQAATDPAAANDEEQTQGDQPDKAPAQQSQGDD